MQVGELFPPGGSYTVPFLLQRAAIVNGSYIASYDHAKQLVLQYTSIGEL